MRPTRDLAALGLVLAIVAGGAAISHRRGRDHTMYIYATDQTAPAASGVHLQPAEPDQPALDNRFAFNYICNDENYLTHSFQIGGGGDTSPLRYSASVSHNGDSKLECHREGEFTPAELSRFRGALDQIGVRQMRSGSWIRARPNHFVTISQDRISHRVHFYESPSPAHTALLQLMADPQFTPGRLEQQLSKEYIARFGPSKAP